MQYLLRQLSINRTWSTNDNDAREGIFSRNNSTAAIILLFGLIARLQRLSNFQTDGYQLQASVL